MDGLISPETIQPGSFLSSSFPLARFQTCENNQAAKKRAQLGEEDLEDLQVRGCHEQNMWVPSIQPP